MRILRWVRDQVLGRTTGNSRETPVGIVPMPEAIGAGELELSAVDAEQLLRVDPDEWKSELDEQSRFLAQFGDRLPPELGNQHQALHARLTRVAV
jgi:phosphoenolpyruvate carboxykinase (GTP)